MKEENIPLDYTLEHGHDMAMNETEAEEQGRSKTLLGFKELGIPQTSKAQRFSISNQVLKFDEIRWAYTLTNDTVMKVGCLGRWTVSLGVCHLSQDTSYSNFANGFLIFSHVIILQIDSYYLINNPI